MAGNYILRPGVAAGSYLEKLRKVWKEVDKETLYKASTDNGLQWVFVPADSPWHQGSVEALVKSAKRCLKFAIGSHRITPSEFMTVCYETANILNELPLGRIPGDDSDINILTPNCLLLGRSTSSVLDSSRKDSISQKTRLGMVNLIAEKFCIK